MRRLAHLSDLHFGTEEPAVVAALTESVHAFAPDLVVVTGDLTQRAKHIQFASARSFLDGLDRPYLVVPGNHDIEPVWRPLARIVDPFRRYRRLIEPVLDRVWQDDELCVVGLSSVRPSRWKEGRVSSSQRDWLASNLRPEPGQVRILATHHPVLEHRAQPASGSEDALLSTLIASDVSVSLSGHLHVSFSGLAVDRVGQRQSVLAIHASTATSRRLRGEANAYNRITLSGQNLKIEGMSWDGSGFSLGASASYGRSAGTWLRLSEPGP